MTPTGVGPDDGERRGDGRDPDAGPARREGRDRRRAPRYPDLGFEAVIDGVAYPVADISRLGVRILIDAAADAPHYQPDDTLVFEIATTGRRRRTLFHTFGLVVRRDARSVAVRYHTHSRFWPRFLDARHRRQRDMHNSDRGT